MEHRFYDIQEELEVLVFFAPAEQGWNSVPATCCFPSRKFVA
jgi:hypothetical protein